MFHLISIVEALEDAGEEVQQFPGQEMGCGVLPALCESLRQNSAQEHHAEGGRVPKGTLVLHVGGELIERLFDGRQIAQLLQHSQVGGKLRPPAIGGGEPVPRDIRDFEMGDIGSVFLCHVAALLIPPSGCGTPSPARYTTDSAWFPDCFSRLDL